MKNLILLLISIFLLTGNSIKSQNKKLSEITSTNELQVQVSQEFNTLAKQWETDFNLLYPDVKLKMQALAETENIGKPCKLKILSGENSNQIPENCWKATIGKDIIVAIINSENTNIKELHLQGLSSDDFKKLVDKENIISWNCILKNGNNVPVHYYYVNNASVKKYLNTYVNSKNNSGGTGLETTLELVSAIEKDINGIGFCKLADILQTDNTVIASGISLVPIDKNGNGKIDYMEDIYSSINDFLRGVWIGKYPNALFSNIYLAALEQPTNEVETKFINWLLTDGQQTLYQYGYCELSFTERMSQVNNLNEPVLISGEEQSESQNLLIIIGIFAVLIAAGIAISLIISKNSSKVSYSINHNKKKSGIFDLSNVVVPKGLYFDVSHTWAFMDEKGIVKVGVDDFIQQITGAFSKIEMKKEGENIRKGELLCTLIQNGKKLNIHAPVTGVILERNENLAGNSAIINISPYNQGWVYKIEPANWVREIMFMNMAEKYSLWLKSELTRFKDFISHFAKSHELAYAPVIMQDGGELPTCLLSDLGPEIWEEFQRNYIDTAK